MRSNTLVTTLLVASVLGGCSAFNNSTTIARLQDQGEDLTDLPLPQVMHADVREEYRQLLEIIEDRKLQEQIERRIASVYMMEADYNQLIGVLPGEDGYFPEAIDAYHEILEKYPSNDDNDEALYQLAKAYDLDGRDTEALEILNRFIIDHPHSPRLAEVYFRKGDIHFRHEQYEDAESAYKSVVALGAEPTFLNNSYYLLGWAQYKLSDYDNSLMSLSQVLDRLVPDNGRVEDLDNISRSLVDDTLRIMSIGLAHAGGAAKISSMFDARPESAKYTWILYSSLGQHFLEKERFEDSAESFRAFVAQNPDSERAPEMHAEMIRAYVDGEFSQQVLAEKESYVRSYGIRSEYWQQHTAESRGRVMPNLKVYIDELARHYHATGQRLKRELAEATELEASPEVMASEMRVSFRKAASFYGEFEETFPADPKVPEMVFMSAEASFDGEDYPNAIKGYERTAYEFRDIEHGADAGYAAIIAYQKELEQLIATAGDGSERVNQWRAKGVDSQLRFVQEYREDERSGAVLAKAAEEMFELGRYDQALEIATSVVSREGEIDPALNRTAYGVIAHCQYELGNFPAAEQGYRDQLAYIPAGSEDAKKVTERMAVSIYKQGELALAADDMEGAVVQFLRIKTAAPTTDVRVIAQFDAATHLMTLEYWDRALNEMTELLRLFPNHQLSRQLPAKIAYAYEQDEQWLNAARAYEGIYNDRNAPADERRDALFLSAEMFEKGGEDLQALEYFKKWAFDYEEPFNTRMEARYHIAYLYKRHNDLNRHLYWLRRVIDGHNKAPADWQNDRSAWMAAWANNEYGDYWRTEFDRIRLRAPLNVSIPRKNEKLKNALDRYQMAAEYQIADQTTRATFNIADLYGQFAQELMDAPRPPGLSPLEAAQYEIILEEQAIPFEELAIEIHQANIERSWSGVFNEWVEKSFGSMAELNPARFGKQEVQVVYGDGIR
ncbi:tetratricopeptide repeat protein [Marinobacter zhejiangensis]|uniref:Tetratricopeptide repeat-containing protein n=1 Tax=Marinobacter zhejiangensis TaxID=488535 RepID=A0A1I4KXA6_9GAMM|nr:tetratricopeptide repeat protein [Marinobacter zhejiangensis]SFL83385.1 Tetratricopeptide repeat-containing protein [Marinobacter zhejiangensis]